MKKSLSIGIISLFILSVLAPMSVGYDVKTLDTGLIAYWNLDEGYGEVAHDSVNEFHGVVYGASWIYGKIGNALDFDGENDFVILPQSAINFIGSLDEGTIAFWFYYDYNLDQQEIQPLFYLGIDNENELDNMFIIEIGHKNPANRKLYVTWVVDGRIPLCFDSGFHLEEKRWYHFAVVVNPYGNTGYLDGVELVNRHYNFGKAIDCYFLSDITVQDQFTIGYGKTADGKCPHFLYFDGRIDDVRIYDKPLNADEIMNLYNYNGNEPPSVPEIKGQRRFKEGEGGKYSYTIYSTDPDGDDVCYLINWSDGTQEWTGYYASGEEITINVNIPIEKGTYVLFKIKAKDIFGAESDWATLKVTIPRTRAWLRFIDMFPILQRLLDFIK